MTGMATGHNARAMSEQIGNDQETCTPFGAVLGPPPNDPGRPSAPSAAATRQPTPGHANGVHARPLPQTRPALPPNAQRTGGSRADQRRPRKVPPRTAPYVSHHRTTRGYSSACLLRPPGERHRFTRSGGHARPKLARAPRTCTERTSHEWRPSSPMTAEAATTGTPPRGLDVRTTIGSGDAPRGLRSERGVHALISSSHSKAVPAARAGRSSVGSGWTLGERIGDNLHGPPHRARHRREGGRSTTAPPPNEQRMRAH